MIKQRKTGLFLAGFALPALVIFCLFFLLPVATVLIAVFTEGGSAFMRLFQDRIFWNGLYGTLVLGVTAPFFSVCVGLCVAIMLAKLSARKRAAVLVAISLPLTFSGLIVAYGFILLLGRSGFIVMMLESVGFDAAVTGAFIFSPAGLALAYAYYLIPRVVLITLPAILNFDNRQILAARSLGAHKFRAFGNIMLPQIMPSVIAAFCLTATVAIGAYGTALALVGTQVNILPLVLYSKISETNADMPSAAATSLILVVICVFVISIGEMFRGKVK